MIGSTSIFCCAFSDARLRHYKGVIMEIKFKIARVSDDDGAEKQHIIETLGSLSSEFQATSLCGLRTTFHRTNSKSNIYKDCKAELLNSLNRTFSNRV